MPLAESSLSSLPKGVQTPSKQCRVRPLQRRALSEAREWMLKGVNKSGTAECFTAFVS